jgi:hypothetical protein
MPSEGDNTRVVPTWYETVLVVQDMPTWLIDPSQGGLQAREVDD